MTSHLLLVTLGPVQDFIAQARRTRDLWYGSHLLSELSRAAARALVDGEAKLIFPDLKKGDAELEPCLAPSRSNQTPPQNIANKLLAEVPSGVDPKQLARSVRNAVQQYWRDHLATPVKHKCAGLLASGIDAVWNEQVGTFLEFAASWLPLTDYAQTRRQLEQSIAGRKTLRDFDAWTQGRGSVPKSSLDGARETVLRPPQDRDADLVRKYRIADGEQLDAIGLVKRAGGEPEQFVPVVNVALASWLELVSQVAPSELEQLRQACQETNIFRVARKNLPCAQPFPFDASVFLPSRWRSVFEEQGLAGDAEAWGKQYVQPILSKVSEPYPYVACLRADGDRMGRAIDQLGSADEHRRFSQHLAQFARKARDIIEQQHRGALVYAGGDDVLAFVPLPEALSCADDLRKSFTNTMNTACQSIPAEQRPTLSIGLGIGHVMESMGDVLALAQQAERAAKQDRNTLAILVDKRSGGTLTWHASWSADPVCALHNAIAWLQDRLPSRKVYEIASTLARLPKPGEAGTGAWARVLSREVTRSLARVEGGALQPKDVGLTLLDEKVDYAQLHDYVCVWLEQMLIARTFAQASPREMRQSKEVVA